MKNVKTGDDGAERDPKTIADSLTEAQRAALLHPRAGDSSYGWARMGTLEALYSRKLVGRQTGRGALYSPQTAIKWPLTPLGLAVRSHIIGEDK